MLNTTLYLLFTFFSINWFLIFTPSLFSSANFLFFFIWSSFLNFALLLNHPFLDGYYFGGILNIDTYGILVLVIGKIVLIGYLYTLLNTTISGYKELPLLILIVEFGFTTLILSNDLLILYLSIELYSLTFYLLSTIHQNYYTTEAAIKYFIYNFLAGAFFLLGCALIYLDYSTINFIQLMEISTVSNSNGANLGFLFIIISFLFKLSIAPFHFWTPDIYQGVLYPITAFFTIFPKLVIGAFIFRFYLYILYLPHLNYLLFFCGLISIFVGGIGALTQYNIKRLFAYSTILNAGFLITLIGLGTPISAKYFLFYLLTYILANLGLFTILSWSNVSNLLGLKTRELGIEGILLTLPVLSLAGLPPLVGFLAKFTSIYLIFNSGLRFISIFMLIFSIISLFYYLRFVHYLYFYDSRGLSHNTGVPYLAESSNKENVGNSYKPDLPQSYIVIIVNIALLLFSFNPSLLFLTSSIFSLLA